MDQGVDSCDGKDNGAFGSPTASLATDQSLQRLLDGGFDAAAEAYSVGSPASSGAAVRRESGSAWESSGSTPVSSNGSQRSSVASPQWQEKEQVLSPTRLWSSTSSEVDLGGSLAAASRRLDAVQPLVLNPSGAVSTSCIALPAQNGRVLVLRSPKSHIYDSPGATQSLHAWKGTCGDSVSPGQRNDSEHTAGTRSSASSSPAGWFSSTSSPNMSLSPANRRPQSGSARCDGDHPMAAADGGLLVMIPHGNDSGEASHADGDLEEICITQGPLGSPISATDYSPDGHIRSHDGGTAASFGTCNLTASRSPQGHISFQDGPQGRCFPQF